MKRNLLRLIFVWGAFCAACAYQFEGGETFPSGIRYIFIPMFENRTAETGAEVLFTNDLIYEFARHDKDVLANRGQAEAYLSGIIESVSYETIAFRRQDTSIERRVSVALSLNLTDPEGRTIWSAKRVSDNEAYLVFENKLTTEQSRRAAISVISARLAEKIYDRLTDDF